jgi:hypothetical protein
MSFPTETELAQMIADHYDDDLGLADVEPPNAADIALAKKIRARIDTGIYFAHLSDVHGLSLFGRRVIGAALIGALALILVLTTAGAAS